MALRKRSAKTKKNIAKAPTVRSVRSSAAKGATASDLPVLSFENSAAFEHWLSREHSSSRGIWLQLAKKTSGVASVSYQEALDVALAWGWIDGQLKAYDATSWLRKFVPRGARSSWSKINRDKALTLIASKRMRPPGLEQVERAQRDGRWNAAYDSGKNARVPPDLRAALAASPRAAAFFEALEARNRYAILFRVQAPKKAETRARKIQEFIAMLERGQKIHP